MVHPGYDAFFTETDWPAARSFFVRLVSLADFVEREKKMAFFYGIMTSGGTLR
jgi:hypothetical protein